VETDGAATHLTPTAFEEDRRRDAALAVAGLRVVRFTWRQITQDPRAVDATVRALL
jgi:very-short-patch-repair endonuclease